MIKDFARKGKNAKWISQEIGVAENTARKYIKNPAKPHGLKGKTKPSKLDPYKPFLQQLMKQGIYNCTVLLERIQEKGYEGSITILKDYVRPYRPSKHIPAVQQYETEPGQQAQMDWGICQYTDTSGKLHKVPVFVMILSHSRMKYVEFTSRCDLRSMERCIVNAFEYFGGVPKEVLTDNMKTVVDRREAGRVIWNSQFADFAAEIGFIPKVCKVRKPQTKGKVERLVRYIKENFFPGRAFEDLEDLNRQAKQWCQKVNSKIHTTTGKLPAQELNKEELLELPDLSVRERYRWEVRKVMRDAFISFDGIRYGVPWQYSGKEVQVRLRDECVEIYYGEILLAKHPVKHSGSKTVYLKGKYKGIAEKHGIAVSYPYAHLKNTDVEQRDLHFYDLILGGMIHG